MQSKYPSEIILAATRIAESNGVSVEDVIHKFEIGSRKTLLSRSDFFLVDSDISLDMNDE